MYPPTVKRPVASSLATDVYRQLPNYTDVNSFAERGWTTLNLAMTGNETRYHSAGDDLHALDDRSLQHMGDQTLGAPVPLVFGSVFQVRARRAAHRRHCPDADRIGIGLSGCIDPSHEDGSEIIEVHHISDEVLGRDGIAGLEHDPHTRKLVAANVALPDPATANGAAAAKR